MLYLLHFERPYKHARHYRGYTRGLLDRLACHRAGNGARLMEVVTGAGIPWVLARTWPRGTRTLERQLKNHNNGPRLCPICREERHAHRSL